ncbi:MAG: hypothetical protein GY714_18860 [Desulfobacterales bacterium]|nr:hypothetical protein [Desulfobacterales bacterium]
MEIRNSLAILKNELKIFNIKNRLRDSKLYLTERQLINAKYNYQLSILKIEYVKGTILNIDI